jgi:hypothetical protein
MMDWNNLKSIRQNKIFPHSLLIFCSIIEEEVHVAESDGYITNYHLVWNGIPNRKWQIKWINNNEGD